MSSINDVTVQSDQDKEEVRILFQEVMNHNAYSLMRVGLPKDAFEQKTIIDLLHIHYQS